MERGDSLIGFTIVIAVVALLLGLALANADIMNPFRGPAQARAIEQEAAIRAAQEWQALEIRWQEEQIRLEGERQRQEAELALIKFAGKVLTVALAVAILMLAYGATTWIIARARQITATSPPAPLAYRATSPSPDRLFRYARPTDTTQSAHTATSKQGGSGRHPVNFPNPAG